MDPEKLQQMHLPLEGFWLPEAASTGAHYMDDPWWLIYWVCVVTFFLIMAPMFWFAWRYRRKSADQHAESQMDHSQLLEISWSVLPLIFFFWVFVLGFRGMLALYVAPADAMEVRVTGQKWIWSMTYPNGGQTGGTGADFVFPVNKPVKLVLTSKDVIHSFFVPNFRIKSDVVPGRYTTLWFEANKEGEYPVECTEYCGKDHSNMLAKIRIVSQAEYDKWVESINVVPVTVATGEKIYKSYCIACHSIDGSKLVGPSWKGLYGRAEEMSDGTTVTADEAYILESILEPAKKVVKGYAPVMPSFKGQLKQEEIDSAILYIKSLK